MGTGGNKPKDKLHVAVKDHINRCIEAYDFEMPFDLDVKGNQKLLRNSEKPGTYLLYFGNKEFEINISLKE